MNKDKNIIESSLQLIESFMEKGSLKEYEIEVIKAILYMIHKRAEGKQDGEEFDIEEEKAF